jgi:flavin reductase (DIM6/NTAB) family NADH-FMN oxidoreductase RutF
MGFHLEQRTSEPGPIFFLQCGVGEAPLFLAFVPRYGRLTVDLRPRTRSITSVQSGEFVVNMVPFTMAEAMNLTSGEYESTINEFEVVKLNTRPSQVVRPPQVEESPVSFECQLERIIDFGNEPPSGSLVIGEIVCVHLEEHILEGRKFGS